MQVIKERQEKNFFWKNRKLISKCACKSVSQCKLLSKCTCKSVSRQELEGSKPNCQHFVPNNGCPKIKFFSIKSQEQVESIKNRGNLDLWWLETFGDFSEYRSKHHKPKWKPVQHHVRTLPGLKSIWFLISEKFLKFDEKNLSSQPKTCSQKAL